MHISVLKEEAINGLNIKEDGIYVDMTLGYAGHASEILKKNKKGFLFAFDKDVDAIKYSNNLLSKIGDNYKLFNTGNINMKEVLLKENITKVDGFLFDLGVSSVELDESSRGFSYMKDAKLDMRMDQNAKISAYEVVNNYTEEELTTIFYKYGEEKYAKKIAHDIVIKRENKKIETTLELVNIIDEALPFKAKRNGHPAKKVFQALRIEVNNELDEFSKALKDALELLNINGYICVITFHSLEDRICKNIFKEYTSIPKELSKLPIIPEEFKPKYKLIESISPSDEEVINNKRSRSARLRVIERIK